jgi:hypothetical protein
MHPHIGLVSKDFYNMEDMYQIQFEDELLGQDWLEIYASEILDARYQWTDVTDMVPSSTTLLLNNKQTCLQSYERIKSSLMDGWVFTPMKRFT